MEQKSLLLIFDSAPPQRTAYSEVPSQMAAQLRTSSPLYAGEIAAFKPRTAVSPSGVTSNEPPLLPNPTYYCTVTPNADLRILPQEAKYIEWWPSSPFDILLVFSCWLAYRQLGDPMYSWCRVAGNVLHQIYPLAPASPGRSRVEPAV
jgi:hypothetical protein